MAHHTRSNSLPTRSHSFVLKAEEELKKARTFVGTSSLTYEIMLDAIKAVGSVYESINDILCMSSNQNGLSQWQQRRWIDQELKESVKLLDIRLVKKACKDVNKHVSRKSSSLDEDSLFCTFLITEARELTISVLQAVFSSFADQIVGPKSSKWSLVSKLPSMRSAAYKEENAHSGGDD